MNRNLFATLVLLFCIALVITMASCESRSGRRADGSTVLSNQVTVKIVLLKRTNSPSIVMGQFRVKKVLDSTIYFWQTQMPYEIGDTLNVPLTSLRQ